MNKEIILSYVLTTRNKLPYLREVMKRLLENIQPDEEIVITDGASTDGTVEFLADLYKQGKIHQYISEPDCGEAHGFNKGILMASGILIKLLTDDDAFYYPGIQECKNFMLENKEVDYILGNIADVMIGDKHTDNFVLIKLYERDFINWQQGKSSGTFFCGLSMMLRKASISIFGLLDTSFSHVDLEYSFRITHRKAKIALNTSLMVIATRQPFSKSITIPSDIRENEWNRINTIYKQPKIKSLENYSISQIYWSLLKRYKNKFIKKENKPSNNVLPVDNFYIPIKKNEYTSDIIDLRAFFIDCEELFIKYNSENTSQIIYY
jgi:glycosyltransferase involved in cell wall biosynthesis